MGVGCLGYEGGVAGDVVATAKVVWMGQREVTVRQC